ncbi:hypothetical protein pipiens_018433 [Culex pipiens pipiens]|uniref:Uncharacterized protein n=1 Tax=Culex pipiens pipiens TaxID=38569 RepID=A0ABD1CBT6_CULPP
MVTTIKITCDGVFIQSNSYLANRQRSSAASSPASSSSSPGVGPGSDQGSSSGGEADQEDQMSGFNGGGGPTKGDQRDGNNNRDYGDPRSTNNSFQKIARRRYQSEEVLSRYQKISEGSDGSSSSDMVAESDDQFTISFLNTPRGQSGKSLLNQKFIVYNSKKPKPSIVLQQSGGYHPSQYRQFLNGRLKPAFSTSVLTSPSLINAAASGSRPATATPPPGSVSSLSSPSSGFASASPTPTLLAPASNLANM